MSISSEGLVALAAVDALLVMLFFAMRVLPHSRAGAWRRVWLLAWTAALMFIVAEVAAIVEGGSAFNIAHQVSLFAAIFALAGAFAVAYLDAFRSARRLTVLASTDPLTGLAHARAFDERLRLAYLGSEPFSVAYMDLDGFKRVNDTYGHERGDAVLRVAGSALADTVRRSDAAARLGGDEFAMLLIGTGVEDGFPIARRALGLVHERLAAHLSDLPISASVGIAGRDEAADPRAIIAAADRAMYAAKRGGGGRVSAAPAA